MEVEMDEMDMEQTEGGELEIEDAPTEELEAEDILGGELEDEDICAEERETEDAPLEATEAEDLLDTELAEPADITDDPDFIQWSRQITADLDQPTLVALWKDVEDRTPLEVELADAALHPEYESQKIFLTDADTGQALRDEEGNWLTARHRLAGSQAPDGFFEDAEGIHLREQKNYTDMGNLLHNITDQTASRRAAFGQEVDITYILAPHFTVEQAEHIQRYCEEQLGVAIEWQD